MPRMALANSSFVTEFLLVGLTDQSDFQIPLFFLFLVMYIVTEVGNLGLIILIVLNSHLHTPMYFFLFNLSLIDLCYSSVIIPKMLGNFVLSKNIISYMGSICNPLLYNTAMSPKVCFYLIFGSYFMGFSDAMIHTGCILRLTFCDGNTVNHYFCDMLPLLQLSCTSTYVNEIEIFIVGGKDIFVPTLIIFFSYVFILSSILKIRSTEGRSKAFSTCTSHIIAVFLFFGSGAFMYLKPSSAGSMDEGKISSVFYTIVVPGMNPLIYSLRNKDVKVAVRKTLSRRRF
uniref:G-protein coupled receptors family 1 profile domain-containing protein n=1 Tax=Castor canadensis TaxID=51338 RepID=A0A8C0ZNM9_CASCN